MKQYHFISGLPRSGTTLLGAILKQNPRFTAGISDPLHGFIHGIIRETNTAVGMDASVPIHKRRELIKDLFASFYKHDNQVCFNTNRAWCADTALLKDIFPDFKMIVCVRHVPWILDSFERLNNRNPHTIKPLYHHQMLANVTERCMMLMGEIPNFGGYVMAPLLNVQQSMFCEHRNHLCFVDYDTLVQNPRQTVWDIYKFLGEPVFDHDFANVQDNYDEFDQQAKIQGLHTVRPVVSAPDRQTVLPDSLWNKYASQTFWRSDFSQFSHLNWMGMNLSTTQPVPRQMSPKRPPPTGRQL